MRLIAAILLLLSGATVLATATPASAELVCHTVEEVITMPNGEIKTTIKEVCVEDGEEGGPESSGCTYEGADVPCTKLGFTWFGSQGCYAFNVTDEYPPDKFTEYWQGKRDGSLWQCQGMGPDMINIGSPSFFWAPGPTPVDGRAAAQQVLSTMNLAKPTIHLAPEPPKLSYVGLETWLWMNDTQWATLTDGASLPSARVTVTATPIHATWNTGDGKSETCTTAGVAWEAWMNDSATTSCWHTYQKTSDQMEDDKFPVTAILTYTVEWKCTGNCISSTGTLDDTSGPVSDVSGVRVSERQSVIVSGE
jgi:hypothetical protein